MICPGGRARPCCIWTLPLEVDRVELMQIVQIVLPISSSEDIDATVIAISRVHVARSWRAALSVEVKPLSVLQVKDVHVIGSQGSLPKPAADNVKFMINQGGGMSVSPRGRGTLRPFSFHPLEGVSVKNPQVAMILLPVIAPKNVQLFIVESGSVILDLRGHLSLARLPSAAASNTARIRGLHLLT